MRLLLQPWVKRELERFGYITLAVIICNVLIVYPLWDISNIVPNEKSSYPWHVSYQYFYPLFYAFSLGTVTYKNKHD